VDTPFDQTYPTNTVAVAKVLTSQADAEVEVARLNELNANKSCVYFYCTSRLIEEPLTWIIHEVSSQKSKDALKR
jgi:hypothetical protein